MADIDKGTIVFGAPATERSLTERRYRDKLPAMRTSVTKFTFENGERGQEAEKAKPPAPEEATSGAVVAASTKNASSLGGRKRRS
jgi:hypothetical protein